MDMGRKLNRLQVSVTFLWVIVAIVGAIAGMRALIYDTQERTQALHCTLDPATDEVRVSASSDGPFVVFGLAASGESTGDKRWAPFTVPLTITDSAGASVKLADLKWVDYLGQPSTPPVGRPLTALYVRPLRAKPLQASLP